MPITLPFLTTYDPPGASEGTLDPLGLYQIADQLAVKLVPAVRERMQRIRFLTGMAVGSMVTEGLEGTEKAPALRGVAPYLVWEWLVVESLIRTMDGDASLWGVPGTQVTRRALAQQGYLDARSYLKTPRIFGFHGVYKRLAVHLGIVDVHLGRGPNAEPLVDAWARGRGLKGLEGAKPLLRRWRTAVERSLREKPPRTKPAWTTDAWGELANAFSPAGAKSRERRVLHELLHAADEQRLGALPAIWALQGEFGDEEFDEELLHDRLAKRAPEYRPLLGAIRAYESFARGLQDGFDILRAEAAGLDARGYTVADVAGDPEFVSATQGLHGRFESAYQALGSGNLDTLATQGLFGERFKAFSEPMDAGTCALALCAHHEAVQRAKSASGKRPWFDRLADDTIFIRHAYRQNRPDGTKGRYVHDYRGWPIRRFHEDLT